MALPGSAIRSSYASLRGISAADIDAAYARAVKGNAPQDFNFLLDVANGKGDPADVTKAQNAVNDLLIRGWYGGTRAGGYERDSTSDTVNHGQPLLPASTTPAPIAHAPAGGGGAAIPWTLVAGAGGLALLYVLLG